MPDRHLPQPSDLVGGATGEPHDVSGEPVALRAALRAAIRDRGDLAEAIDHAAIVAETNVQGTITYVNRTFCEISGYSYAELIGENHRIVNSGHHPRTFWVTMYRTIARGHVWRGEICNRAKSGKLYWVDTTIVPFLDDDGKPHRYMAIRFDITARKGAEAQLREQAALARLGEMASVVAHEVKNPLAGISGALQVVERRLAEASPERRVIGDILSRIAALNSTMEDLLLFARPRKLEPKPVDVRVVADAVATHAVRDPRLDGIALTVDGAGFIAAADAAQLEAALLNLVINAAQALKNRGTITVALGVDGGLGRIDVRDDGPGIPLERRARVFEPFFTTRHQGTGLGLAIVRRVVEGHGGTVALDCPAGGGTIVSIRLPLQR
jgi:PAS domain S-box-containing protein